MDKAKKKATIIISLVSEADLTHNEEIKKQIEKVSIPFLAEVEKVIIEEAKNPYNELREHGFSKKVARNIVRFYAHTN
jgi:uncharacterized protein (UPF0335 family)